MAAFTALASHEAEGLARRFELGNYMRSRPILEGSVNSNHRLETSRGAYFVRIYEEQTEEGALRDVELAVRLAERGVRTPAPLADRSGARLARVAGKVAAVFPWVHGEMVCQAGVTPALARAVGEALGEFHCAARGVSASAGRFRAEDVRGRLVAISDARFLEAARALTAALDRWVARRNPRLPRGLVHGDLFRDNVLWSGGSIAALLDFESAADGPYAYDLAVTLLAWCFGDAFRRELAAAMLAGYESRRALAPEEREGLLAEACVAAVRFAATRITDYALRPAGARVMKDWRRFEARLVALEASGLPLG